MPRSTPCPSCGQMFLLSGLRFHQKTCEKRQRETLADCPYCKMAMPQISMDGHVATCKAARRAMDNSRKEAAHCSWAPTAPDGKVVTWTTGVLRDGRSRCQFCGRGFLPNRIHQHSAICVKLRQARPTGVGGVRTQLPQRVYNAAAARTSIKGSFDRQSQRLFITRASAESKGILVKNAGVARKIGSKGTASLAPWQVLGVPRGAGAEEVKRAYKRLAMEWHPDRHQSEEDKVLAEAKFKAIGEAYEILSKPRRARRRGGHLALVAPEVWRQKHQEWIGMRGGWPGGAHRGTHDDRVLCPHCGRRFGALQAERHIPKCNDIIHKPKPLPRRPNAQPSPAKPQLCAPGTQRPPACGLTPGITIRIDGLTGAVHLNGTKGILVSFDTDAQRWHVQLQGGDTKALRPENLLRLAQASSTAVGSRRVPTPTGACTAASGQKKSAKQPPAGSAAGGGFAGDGPERRGSGRGNCSFFAPGLTVLLEGLVGAAHLNGLTGVLGRFDEENCRWHVDLHNGEIKAVRPENLMATMAAAPAPTPPTPSRASPGNPPRPPGKSNIPPSPGAQMRATAPGGSSMMGGSSTCAGDRRSRLPPMASSAGFANTSGPPQVAVGGGGRR